MRRIWRIGAPMLMMVSACSTEHEFRIEAAGDPSADKSQAGIAPGGSIIVAAGNILLGPASALARSQTGVAPLSAQDAAAGLGLVGGDQTALISGTLLSSGQTIVQLDSGAALLIGGVGGAVGDAVTLSPTTGMVTSGPASLMGSTIQAVNPTLVTPTIALADPLPTRLGGGTAAGTIAASGTAPVVGVISSPLGTTLGGVCC